MEEKICPNPNTYASLEAIETGSSSFPVSNPNAIEGAALLTSDKDATRSASLEPKVKGAAAPPLSCTQILQCIFSSNKRAEICQAAEAQGRNSPAAKAVYVLYAVAGCFFFINAFVLISVASDIHNKVCEDSSLGGLMIAVAAASLLSILWLALNQASTSTPNNLLFMLLVTGLAAVSVIIHSNVQINQQCYDAPDSKLWDTYLSVNWILTAALFLESFVARVPWAWFFCDLVVPLAQSFLIWSDLDLRKTLLEQALSNHASSSELLSSVSISSRSVHKLLKLVLFVYTGLYSLFILGIAQYLSDYRRFGFDRVAEECFSYAVTLLVVVILTMLYLPMPFLVPFAATGSRPLLQALMLLLVSAVVALTVVAEVLGDASAQVVMQWLWNHQLSVPSSSESYKGLVHSRWYLHLSWLLLLPLFLDCVLMLATSCRSTPKHGKAQHRAAAVKAPLLVVSSSS